MSILSLVAAMLNLVYASESFPPECALAKEPYLHVAPVSSKIAGYFQQPLAEKKYVAQMGGDGMVTGYLIDFDVGKSIPITYGMDPFPTPDEEFILTSGPLQFFRIADLLKNGPAQLPVYEDQLQSGNYESVGLLMRTPLQATYRVLTTQDNGSIRDYKVGFSVTGDVKFIEPVQARPLVVCPEIQAGDPGPAAFNTPILSKTGTEFSTLDGNSQSTKIYQIDDQARCKLIQDLGVFTGKCNFSFDSRKLAFHANSLNLDFGFKINQSQGDDPNHIDVPFGNQAFVFDRDHRTITPLTSALGRKSQSIFPGFRKDGTVVFVQMVRNETSEITRSYVLANPDTIPSVSISENLPSELSGVFKDRRHYFRALVALGSLWALTCRDQMAKPTFSAEDVAFFTRTLDPNQCPNLVNKFWNQETIERLEKQEFLLPSADINGAKPPSLHEVLKKLEVTQLRAVCPK